MLKRVALVFLLIATPAVADTGVIMYLPMTNGCITAVIRLPNSNLIGQLVCQ